jgi:hypothetical protein
VYRRGDFVLQEIRYDHRLDEIDFGSESLARTFEINPLYWYDTKGHVSHGLVAFDVALALRNSVRQLGCEYVRTRVVGENVADGTDVQSLRAGNCIVHVSANALLGGFEAILRLDSKRQVQVFIP